jgi:hypothetical protein
VPVNRRSSALLSLAAVSAALLVGCGSGGDDVDTASGSSGATSSSPSSTAAGTAEPDDAAVDAPPFQANTDPDTEAASSGAFVTVSDIRTGRQDGFDRVVFEVGGTGTPGWDVRYVDQASSQGSGEPVDVAGDAVLQVTITGAGLPDDTGVAEFGGPIPLPGSGTKTVTEVVFDHTFEGTTVAFAGTTARVPFRVFALANPARVVVDVRDA